ncbi:MAG: nucleotidyltransferase domain-containing protein [Desulfobacteraceae bacterium]|nr:nucleotidyltransferase domain-containing protein [Desulfobacteraceae bacterium]
MFAYLFGSQAKGTSSVKSDLDIAVFLDHSVKDRFFDIKTNLYLQLSRTLKRNDIDIIIINQCRNIILLNQIITNGQLLYEKNKSARLDYEQKILHSAIDFKSQRKMVMGV